MYRLKHQQKNQYNQLGKNPAFLKKGEGFTLIELLVVIGILAVLSVVIILTLNPAQILMQSRDAVRVSDLSILNKALAIHAVDGSGSTGDSTMVYISLPDADNVTPGTRTVGNQSSCGSISSLPNLPPAYSYNCVGPSDFLKANGDGWVPVDFTTIGAGTPISNLPRDPINDAAQELYYVYVSGGSYVVTASLESQKQIQTVAYRDGGSDPARVEMGSDINLWKKASGLIGYWKLDGDTVDSSGNGNTVASYAGISFPASPPGKVGGAVRFVTDGYIEINDSPTLFADNVISIAAWVRRPTTSPANDLVIYGNYFKGVIPQGTYSLEIVNSGVNVWDGVVFYTNDYDGANYTENLRRMTNNQTFSVNPGQWAHVAITWDGRVPSSENITVYLNGNKVFTDVFYGITPGAASRGYRIGRRFGNTEPNSFASGMIDELRVYNRALSAAEVFALYDSTK